MKEDIIDYNKKAWDREVRNKNEWTQPVSSEVIEKARKGDWEILLTPTKSVPRSWFPPLKNSKALCLASGGGQQAPVLAAAGAEVTLLDNSPLQIAQDKMVAERDHLDLKLIEGNMVDLGQFQDGSFDFIFHPVSNLFVPNIRPMWKECFRILKPGGLLISGFCNSIIFLFDRETDKCTSLEVKYSIPYSDLESLSEDEKEQLSQSGEPLEFGHSLDDQIGGQIEAGFEIIGFYEDRFGGACTIDKYTSSFIATRARKPS